LHPMHALNRGAIQAAMITQRHFGIGIQGADTYRLDCIGNHQTVATETYSARPGETKRPIYTQHWTCAKMFALTEENNAAPPPTQPRKNTWQQQIRRFSNAMEFASFHARTLFVIVREHQLRPLLTCSKGAPNMMSAVPPQAIARLDNRSVKYVASTIDAVTPCSPNR